MPKNLLLKAKIKEDHYSKWNEWKPKEYLSQFFTEIGPDTVETLKFLIENLSYLEKEPISKILDFGCGPTPIISLAVSPYAKEIHMADYLYSNLIELQKWTKEKNASFNWNKSIEQILSFQNKESNRISVLERANNLRKKAKILHCDASLPYPISPFQGNYPIVLSIFCPDSATDSKIIWRKYMKNIFNLVAPNGLLLIAALRNCKGYRIGEKFFPSANINEDDLIKILSRDFVEIIVKVKNVFDCSHQGFESIMFAKATKKGRIKHS